MDFATAAKNLEVLGRRLEAASTLREAVLASAPVFSLLSEVERQIEITVRELAGGGEGSPVVNEEEAAVSKPAGGYAGAKIADAAADFLKRNGPSHGKVIQRGLIEGGLDSKARFFQANLSTALNRDDRFEKVSPNMWTLKKANPSPDSDAKPFPISPDLGVGNGVNGLPPNAKIQRLVDRSRQLEAGGR